jgi:hypothetical protein
MSGRLADDSDRARRVLQHSLGDGAEGHLVETVAATCPYHDELSVRRRGQ